MGACLFGYGLNEFGSCGDCPVGMWGNGYSCVNIAANCYANSLVQVSACPNRCSPGTYSYPGASQCFTFTPLSGVTFNGPVSRQFPSNSLSDCLSNCTASKDNTGAPNCAGFDFSNSLCTFKSTLGLASVSPNSTFWLPTPVSSKVVYQSAGPFSVTQNNAPAPYISNQLGLIGCQNYCQLQGNAQFVWNPLSFQCSCMDRNDNVIGVNNSLALYVATRCPPGTYKTNNDVSGCTPCPLGRFSDTYGTVGVCPPVESGCYATRIGETSSCPFICGPGSFSSPGQTVCQITPPGHYQNVPKLYFAAPCAVGYYQPNYGQTECFPVNPGCYSDLERSTVACPNQVKSDCFSPYPGAVTECPFKCQQWYYSNPGAITCQQKRVEIHIYHDVAKYNAYIPFFIGRLFVDQNNLIRGCLSLLDNFQNILSYEIKVPGQIAYAWWVFQNGASTSVSYTNVQSQMPLDNNNLQFILFTNQIIVAANGIDVTIDIHGFAVGNMASNRYSSIVNQVSPYGLEWYKVNTYATGLNFNAKYRATVQNIYQNNQTTTNAPV